ncbi:hypothetical protein [Sphingobium chungbukense]|uniref:hypothetical protein n=1 Tax=Sphingobium chungbukense TaxID=56193 RepID=UPI00069A2F2D|nr:hypothetical protein [Sphingobium chungbukense]
MPRPNIAIRLGTEGAADVRRDVESVGTANEAAANRARTAWDKASSDIEAAQRRQAAAAAKIAAIAPQTATQMRINDAVGTGSTLNEGSARVSAAAFREAMAAQEEYERGATRLRAALDPAFAAQQRFNAEITEARTLLANGAISLDEYSKKLWQEQQALAAASAGHGRVATSSNAMKAGLQSAGFQVQDFLVQVNGGTGALRAFSMQAPQFIGSLQLMAHNADSSKGKFSSFMNLLGGPWGVALGIAIPAAAMLAEKLLDGGDAAKEAQKAIDKHRDAVEALNKAMRDSILTAQDRARASFVEAESERLSALATRNKTQALLEQAKLVAEQKRDDVKITARGDVVNPGFVSASREVDRLAKLLAENQAALKRQTDTANIAQGQYIAQILRDMRTPSGRVNQQYDQQVNAIIKAGGDANKQAAAINRLEAARAAELKRIDEQSDALRKSANARRDGDTATPSQVSKLLLEAFGGTITSTTGGQHVKGSYHYRGQAVDFVPTGGMGAISKEQIRALLEGAGLQIKELLGPGDKGHNDHFHVAWAGGKGEMDSARIMGQLIAEEVRKSLALEKQRNEWLNEQGQHVGEGAAAALGQEGERLAENRRAMAEMRSDISSGTALLNIEWQLRGKSRDVAADMLELERYRLDIARQFPGATAEQIAELLKAKQSQIEMNRLLEDFGRDWQEVTEFGRGFVDTVLSPSTWDSWGGAGKTILRELQNEMMKLAIVNPIKNLLFGDGLPTLGSVLGGIGKKPGHNAVGTSYWSGGMTYVGEQGRELVDLPRGSKIYSASDTRQMMQPSSHVIFEVRPLKGATFDAEVSMVSDTRIAQSAPVIAAGSSQGAQAAMQRRAGRRLA